MDDQVDRNERGGEASVQGFADGLPGPSPLGAIAEVAEAAEASMAVQPSPLVERMERFPELRDVKLPGGSPGTAAALQAVQRQAASETEEDGVSKAAGKGFVNGYAGGLNPGAGVGERFDRFPELRGVALATGNAARFPELVVEAADEGVEQPAEDNALGR